MSMNRREDKRAREKAGERNSREREIKGLHEEIIIPPTRHQSCGCTYQLSSLNFITSLSVVAFSKLSVTMLTNKH